MARLTPSLQWVVLLSLVRLASPSAVQAVSCAASLEPVSSVSGDTWKLEPVGSMLAGALSQDTTPSPPPFLRGEVRVGTTPLSQGTVVLHQVSADASGEIDSVRVGPDGSFSIPLPHVPDHGVRAEIYFASVQHQGLYYFGPAITDAGQLDSLYTIQAFDTLSVPPGGADLPLTARNLFLERAEDGWEATDVFQLRHDGDRTLYSPDDGVVWSYPLPDMVRDFQVGQADLAPDAVRFWNGRIELFAPLPPGEKFLVVRYRIPERDFLLPMPGTTDQMEILVREPGPAAEFPPLGPATPVELEPGTVFRRYSGDGFLDTGIQAQVAPERWSFRAEWLGLLLAGLLGAAGVYGFRRRSARLQPPGVPEPSRREELLLAIARLDEEFGGMENPSDADAEAYRARRRKLLSQLKRYP
jgi:hypothetical protein